MCRTDKNPLPLVPYLESGSLRVEDLMSGVRPADTEAAFAALRKVAESEKMQGLEETIENLENRVQEQREAAAREIAPEVRPVAPTSRQSASPHSSLHSDSTGAKVVDNGEPEIRFSIANLRKALEPINSAASPMIRQRALEESALNAAMEELQHSAKQMESRIDGSSQALSRERLQAWMHEWLVSLTERLGRDILDLKERIEHQRAVYPQTVIDEENEDEMRKKVSRDENNARKDELLYLLLTVLSPQKLALITILELMRSVGSQGIIDGVKTVRAVLAVGRAVETEYQAETIQSLAGIDSKTWQNVLDPNSQKPVSRLITSAWHKIGKSVQGSEGSKVRQGEVDWSEIWTPSWTQNQVIDVGSVLLKALTDTATVKRSAEHPKTHETV
jgi:DNA-directed RNA polymerase